ncbi:NADH:ubiquinone oxidoreductase subunit F (NADH-binding) [Sinomonas atrocyanea]|uniref:NADH-ubiquinone oxidoreductase-F iron-sulfur binding region domain-containing protein n=1 Tax=Sinomonas atrocyanea TaxID=37927 RepID=UPI0027877192|nr:NADH-ubiquinone oxidoreductase-F iron-sulfur binding region domain-containing protein [Sinomonas atrocyanea]MDP9883446.1 NADH:ubiquinone oxidoreductase subunit F (NADH-binding) [Sinomonas atrocyanea]
MEATAATDIRLPALGTGRLFAATGPGRAAHEAAYGARRDDWTRGTLLTELESSGLAGRGGAGFPAWRKLSSISGRRPVVIANGAEGEPVSRKDAALLRWAPHLVLDGLLDAGEALGASQLFLYAPADSLAAVRDAVAERRDARRVRLVEAPRTFISGEATAVVSALEGGPALPRDTTQRLSSSGYRGQPTLLHNIETLAHLALVARYGASWFRSTGTREDPGTRLVSLAGDVPAEAVLEVPGGATVREILQAGGVNPASTAAVLVGGFHGAWVPSSGFDRPMTTAGLARYGGRPGAGVLLALAQGRCGLAAAAPIARYLADSSAQQCGPCMFGLPAMAAVVERIAGGERTPWLASEAERLAGLITGRGACRHPDGAAGFVRSTLSVFRDEVHAHLGGSCVQGWQR